MADFAKGFPTKEFFVGMLTRDIALSDAILDLLDNCLDGVVRQKGASTKKDDPNYYEGYHSNITITNNSFIIEDNCGGIPRDIAIKYAFRMGRSSEKDPDELPTVGIYGIGMKRAIFKIGKSSTITTKSNEEYYKVTIPIDWSSNEEDWNFAIEDLENSISINAGTVIEVTDLNPEIATSWANVDKIEEYCEQLISAVQQSYSFIIQKGFEISINGKKVSPLPIKLLVSTEKDGNTIKPFLYQQKFDDVNVSLAVGFYTSPPSPDDIDDENELRRSSSDAGWTVVCNDRVVLYNDKSHLTGWGEAGVPQYHTQFIGIRGIVIFESNNPQNLPMTTTKRGIDTSSKIYSVVKDKMRYGLKMFTDYTNRWKGQNLKEREFSTSTQSIAIETLIADHEEISSKVPAISFKESRGGFISSPNLPKPPKDRPYKNIRYSRDYDEILEIVEYFYHDRNHEITPSQIGEKCFDEILDIARSKKGR